MRGLLFFLAFTASLPLIFVTPFNGVLIWYGFSLGNFHTLIWGGPFASLNYAYVIAILTCFAWLFSRTERKWLPFTPLVVLTLLFALWITITSWVALAPPEDVWGKWSTCRRKVEMSPDAQNRDDTPRWRRARRERVELYPCSESRAAYLITALDWDWLTIVGDW